MISEIVADSEIDKVNNLLILVDGFNSHHLGYTVVYQYQYIIKTEPLGYSTV